ncbi:MAG: acyl-CoA thioesterase domain-containing protein [Myxococcota bacterium]|nr:acyl-CoA thioesterase domain-containing protein [Myxococcota bacterium]
MDTDFIYEEAGDQLIPTAWAGGPWAEGLQHGGPVNALFARAAEQAAAETGFQVVRLTVDLFKPVPTVPLRARHRFIRRGRRIANVEIELTLPGEEKPLCRATAVLMQRVEELGRTWHPEMAPAPTMQNIEELDMIEKSHRSHLPDGFHLSLQVGFGEDALGTFACIRSPLQLVAGETITPLQHCAAVADLTFGLSIRLRLGQDDFAAFPGSVSLINTDTTIQWERPPVGRQIFFRDSFISDEAGIGVASVSLYDEKGRLGLSTQVLLDQQLPAR